MKDFVGRIEELQKLDEILKKERVCVISGLAGIGKTYLAKHYLDLKKEEGKGTLYIRYFELDNYLKAEVEMPVPQYLVIDDMMLGSKVPSFVA